MILSLIGFAVALYFLRDSSYAALIVIPIYFFGWMSGAFHGARAVLGKIKQLQEAHGR